MEETTRSAPNRTSRRLNKAGSASNKKNNKNTKNKTGKSATIKTAAALKKNEATPAAKKKSGVIIDEPITTVSGSEAPPSVGTQTETTQPPASEKIGVFENVRRTLDAVNQQSYYQAVALNKELEDKGVLPRLEGGPKGPSAESEEAAAGGDKPGPSSGSVVGREKGGVVSSERVVKAATAGDSDGGDGGGVELLSEEGDSSKPQGRGKKGKKKKKKGKKRS